ATLRGGLGELVEALAGRIEGEILTGTAVTALRYKQQYELVLDDGRTLTADAVILAIPTYAMADLLAEHDAQIAEQLSRVIYTPVTTVNVAFNRQDVPDPFDGFGVVIPESEESQLLAVEGMSVKFPHRAPDDQFVLRAFVGGQARADLAALPDDELTALVLRELAAIFGIEVMPTAVHITRWLPANPQPPVGHLALIAEVEQRLQTILPHLSLTGAGMRGQGIPDCIRQSQALAGQVWKNEMAQAPLLYHE
ncbi:MAG TPA: protoporphyrinogen oxidase, partial [Anaerolineae bacterium]|nr:protoporphyrinogen oxidase [Anaerolineae bacterium]